MSALTVVGCCGFTLLAGLISGFFLACYGVPVGERRGCGGESS